MHRDRARSYGRFVEVCMKNSRQFVSSPLSSIVGGGCRREDLGIKSENSGEKSAGREK